MFLSDVIDSETRQVACCTRRADKMVRFSDLIIVLLKLSAIANAGFCSGNLYGFPCCKQVVYKPEYDKNGYPYGIENGKSCVRFDPKMAYL